MNEQNYLDSVRKQLRYYKKLGDQCLDQVSDESIHWTPGPSSNSLAVIVKHIAGNMRSRWTNFLTEDGEKSWRNRDSEFEDTIKDKEALLRLWEEGWKCFLGAIDQLTVNDLSNIVYIRNEGHSVVEAIQRQLSHYPYHIGQMIYLTKILTGDEWVSLSIPKNQSAAFNQDKFSKEKSRKHFTEE